MPDYTVVTHENPVLGVEKVVRVELDPSWDPIRYEDLTIIILDDGRNVVSCVPLFAKNVHLGDIINAVENPSTGQLEYGDRVDRGQSWVFRISPRDEDAFRIVHDVIHEFGGAVETWGSITGVAIRGDAAADQFADRLQQLENDGLLEYDTAER